MFWRALVLAIFVLSGAACSHSPSRSKTAEAPKAAKGFDQLLSQYAYPFPVQSFPLNVQGESLQMTFADLKPAQETKLPVVLFHGKNFSGFYFDALARELLKAGHRVIIPDQIGFGKSSKPVNLQFSFAQLATSTNELLMSLKVEKFTLVGHSMGGMLATRYALLFPKKVDKLILVNPIGLEDYGALAAYRTVAEHEQNELKNTTESLRNYQKTAYYDGQWKPEYEKLLVPAIGWNEGPDRAVLAKIAARTTEMIFTQPVVNDFTKLDMPTVLILGQRDRTALGKPWASPENQKRMGNYPKLGPEIARKIPQGKLIALQGLGHVPFLEAPDVFLKVFLPELK